jgi:hypothetical protein
MSTQLEASVGGTPPDLMDDPTDRQTCRTCPICGTDADSPVMAAIQPAAEASCDDPVALIAETYEPVEAQPEPDVYDASLEMIAAHEEGADAWEILQAAQAEYDATQQRLHDAVNAFRAAAHRQSLPRGTVILGASWARNAVVYGETGDPQVMPITSGLLLRTTKTVPQPVAASTTAAVRVPTPDRYISDITMDETPDLLIEVTELDCRIARETRQSPLEIALRRRSQTILVDHSRHRLAIDGRLWSVCDDTIAADVRGVAYTAVLSPVDARVYRDKPRDDGDFGGEMFNDWQERCKLDLLRVAREGDRRLEPAGGA